MAERLQKLLSRAGVSSRRQAEELIRAGRVTVNGEPASIGQIVDSTGAGVIVDGRPLRLEQRRYLALNKPRGVVTTTTSTRGEDTVVGLISARERLYPVGRLDKDTAGLLLLTNDGEWANLIMHPRNEIEKEYRVLVRGGVTTRDMACLRAGTVVEGRLSIPKSVVPVGNEGGNTWLTVVLTQGRKREIRLLCAACGHPVVYLERVRIGHVELGTLAPGRFRDLSKREVERFRAGPATDERARAGSGAADSGGSRRPGRGRQVDHRRSDRPPVGHPRSRHGIDVQGSHPSRPRRRPGSG